MKKIGEKTVKIYLREESRISEFVAQRSIYLTI
jgi:hypothetical protein